ncbi:MAG TPA: redoxin family protein [Patescibacteria group bacterium]|nr:redoxin family protein [Patescibacteria group bacterium]
MRAARVILTGVTILAGLAARPVDAVVARRSLGGMTIETRGMRVVVAAVTPESAAARGGLLPGDVLLVVDDQALVGLDRVAPDEVFRIIDRQRSEFVRLVIGRGASTMGVMFRTRGELPGGPNPPTDGLQVGAVAPPFSARALDGSDVSLAALRGRPVLFDFWASWCPPCRDSVIGLRRIADQYGSRLAIVGIGLDDDPRAFEAFVFNEHLPGHQVHDGGAAGPIGRAYGVPATGIPHVVLVGPDGKVAAIGRMAVDIEAEITRLAGATSADPGGAD